MKALCIAFRKFPTVNAVMDEAENTLVVRKTVNIGIATDTPAGLYVPVIKDVGRKSLLDLALEIQAVVQATQDGTIGLEGLQGGTF
ncbi:MAG: 2-oxo acid dehydrogenase subunit E2, partial [bacterium]